MVRGQYGTSKTCSVDELVVGDLVTIESGMRVPADWVLVEGMDITCDERMYPEGKNMVVKQISFGGAKDESNPDPFLLSRSFVSTGSGRALVLAVGRHTRWTQMFPVEERKI